MKLIIHRGRQEAAGSCVELSSAKSRILLGLGFLADIDAILISHFHLDHYGFLRHANPEIPVYLSQGANLLIEAANVFNPAKAAKLSARVINHKKQLRLGDFLVTPFLVEHSAFDSLAFLVESEGRRLFYSGVPRAYSEKLPQNIDCLLMEGLALGSEDAGYKTEAEIEGRLAEILGQRRNMAFLFVSPENIDRIASAYRACLRTGSLLVMDIYTAFILDKLRKVSKRVPRFNSKNMRIKFFSVEAEALFAAGYRDLLYAYSQRKIDTFEINRNKNKILMLARDNSFFSGILKEIKDTAGAALVYSARQECVSQEFRAFCKVKGLVMEYVPTRPQARLEDLKTFVSAINPGTLVPIQASQAQRDTSIFERVKILKDEESFEF